LGEPYVTTRPAGTRVLEHLPNGTVNLEEAHGLGLGFFIAKTLLERSGARLSLENRAPPAHGAIVRITWPRGAFERRGIREGGAPGLTGAVVGSSLS
jgi:two-component system sensor histidine kinase RegB